MQDEERIRNPLPGTDARMPEQPQKEASFPPEQRNRSLDSPKIRLFMRLALMIGFWVTGMLEVLLASGEGGFPVFNFLASWGAVGAYTVELGIVAAFLLFLMYSTGLFALNSMLARLARSAKWFKHQDARWLIPIPQIMVHWAGVLFAFDKYAEFPLPEPRELVTLPGLVFLLTMILFPLALSTVYIFLDWRLAIGSSPRSRPRN